mgnify:CR=1 FL=1
MAIGRIRFRGLIRAASPFLLVFGALFLLIWPTVEGIVSRWLRFDESYSHGFLLLLVSDIPCAETASSGTRFLSLVANALCAGAASLWNG